MTAPAGCNELAQPRSGQSPGAVSIEPDSALVSLPLRGHGSRGRGSSSRFKRVCSPVMPKPGRMDRGRNVQSGCGAEVACATTTGINSERLRLHCSRMLSAQLDMQDGNCQHPASSPLVCIGIRSRVRHQPAPAVHCSSLYPPGGENGLAEQQAITIIAILRQHLLRRSPVREWSAPHDAPHN